MQLKSGPRPVLHSFGETLEGRWVGLDYGRLLQSSKPTQDTRSADALRAACRGLLLWGDESILRKCRVGWKGPPGT